MHELRLGEQGREAIQVHFRNCLPEECCGLIAGVGRTVSFVYPLTNRDHSASAFTIEPSEHFGALRHAESNGWELIGAFHSHPQGPGGLSPTDLALSLEPDWVYLVISPAGLVGFELEGREARPVELR